MNPLYSDIQESFEKWLQTLGYAESTVYGSVNYLRDFTRWLEVKGIKSLEQITKTTVKDYHNYLQTRKSNSRSLELKPFQILELHEYLTDIRPQIVDENKQARTSQACWPARQEAR